MISERGIKEDVEGAGRGMVSDNIQIFAWMV
jgi:hypothetical protein